MRKILLTLLPLLLLTSCTLNKNTYTLGFTEGEFTLNLLTYNGKGNYALSAGSATLKAIPSSSYSSNNKNQIQNYHDLLTYDFTFLLTKKDATVVSLPLRVSTDKITSADNVYSFSVAASDNPFESVALNGSFQFFANYFTLTLALPSDLKATFTAPLLNG